MKKRIQKRGALWLFVVLLLFGAGLFAVSVSGIPNPLFSAVRQGMSLLQPRKDAAYKSDTSRSFTYDALQQTMRQNVSLRKENQALRKQLQLSQNHSEYVATTCEIVAFGTQPRAYNFWINKGTKQGIKENDPVVCGTDFIGRATVCEETTAMVTSVLHNTVALDGVMENTNTHVVVRGNATKEHRGMITLLYLSEATVPALGQKVQTSGLGNCPGGFLVGTVAFVEPTEAGGFRAFVQPNTDYTTLLVVTVMTKGGKTP